MNAKVNSFQTSGTCLLKELRYEQLSGRLTSVENKDKLLREVTGMVTEVRLFNPLHVSE